MHVNYDFMILTYYLCVTHNKTAINLYKLTNK